MTARAFLAIAFLPAVFAACGGGRSGFQRPDYAAEARARCDEAEASSDPHRALSLFAMALEADPRLARAHFGRAVLLERTGRGPEAERSYSMAVEVAADDIRPRFLLARARYSRRLARIESAVRDCDRAISLLAAFPDPAVAAETRLLRAECRISLRAWDGAHEDLEAATAVGLDGDQAARARSMRIKVDASREEKRR